MKIMNRMNVWFCDLGEKAGYPIIGTCLLLWEIGNWLIDGYEISFMSRAENTIMSMGRTICI